MHVHAEYAPPRSWEQFEELCADVFQSAWQDPGLVRHGRAGQRQDGVDIVGRHGAIYPVGLQCKKRAKWPVSRLTTTHIDVEIKAALNFKPVLKVFYILTTAPSDAGLLAHVRRINTQHRRKKLFEVVLLGWDEIVRRATRDTLVADKHFGPAGSGAPRSPLVATWMMSSGKLELTGSDLELSVLELVQDFHDWPTGHVVVRHRESDDLIERLRPFEGKELSKKQRKDRIKLRDELRILADSEKQAELAVKMMLTDPDLSVYLLKVWVGAAPVAIEAFINNHLRPFRTSSQGGSSYLRMSPPGDADRRCSVALTAEDVSSILTLNAERVARWGKPMPETVGELPDGVRAKVAIPRIMRGLIEFGSEDRLTWDQMRGMQAFDLSSWSATIV